MDGRDAALGAMLATLSLALAWHALGFAHLGNGAPLHYAGDPLYYQYLYQVMSEGGWLGSSERAGAPFGSSQLDFPNVDAFNLLLMRMGALFGGGPFIAFNTYVLATFALCALIAYIVKRRLGLSRTWALVGALAFTMLPFHFQRLGHLFLLAYFCAAIAFWLALDVVGNIRERGAKEAPSWLAAFAAVVCGTSGIYYAFFSCLLIFVVAAHSSALEGTAKPLRRGGLVCIIIVGASMLNLAPTLWHVLAEGRNMSVAVRAALESEIYGIKLTQLLMPRDGHRIPQLANFRAAYEATSPLSNENRTASLGFFGAIGFVILLLVPFSGRLRSGLPILVKAISAPAYAGLLYATIGGFGAIFALLISPQLRGLNRISPFLAFLGILCSAALLSHITRTCASRWTRVITWLAAPLLAICIIFDQVPAGGPFWKLIHSELMYRFERDRAYYGEVERQLGNEAMVLQLPMIRYPEAAPVKQMGAYDALVAILHTKSIRWTAGAMSGRAAEHWQRLFEAFELERRTRALTKLGFAGIDLDLRGLGEERAGMLGELEQHGFHRIAASSDEQNILLAAPTRLAPGQRAFAIAPASAWFAPESSAGEVWMWSTGDATLEVGNLSAEARACRLALSVQSYLVPRTLSLWDGDKKLAQAHVTPDAPTQISATLDAGRLRRTLTLRTDVSANTPPGDPRSLAYRLVMTEIPLCL